MELNVEVFDGQTHISSVAELTDDKKDSSCTETAAVSQQSSKGTPSNHTSGSYTYRIAMFEKLATLPKNLCSECSPEKVQKYLLTQLYREDDMTRRCILLGGVGNVKTVLGSQLEIVEQQDINDKEYYNNISYYYEDDGSHFTALPDGQTYVELSCTSWTRTFRAQYLLIFGSGVSQEVESFSSKSSKIKSENIERGGPSCDVFRHSGSGIRSLYNILHNHCGLLSCFKHCKLNRLLLQHKRECVLFCPHFLFCLLAGSWETPRRVVA